jgi:hypothetical protein
MKEVNYGPYLDTEVDGRKIFCEMWYDMYGDRAVGATHLSAYLRTDGMVEVRSTEQKNEPNGCYRRYALIMDRNEASRWVPRLIHSSFPPGAVEIRDCLAAWEKFAAA